MHESVAKTIENERYLERSIGQFVAQALRRNGNALVIATEAQLASLTTHLAKAALDPEARKKEGQYVPMDAREVLGAIMDGENVVAERFAEKISAPVEHLIADGRRLSIFDGLVAILVGEGRTEAALQLEELWNDLGAKHTFNLLRGYSPNGSPQEPNAEVLERSRTEQHLRHREAELHALVASSDDAIVTKSLEGIITSWNAAASRVFGYTAEEIVGRPILWLIPADRLDEETEILSRLRRGERVEHFETVRRRKDGTLIDVSVTISPILGPNGVILGASKIARDITDRKRAEKALESARRELQETNEQLEARVAERTASLREAVAQMEEFSYTVSHDLRAPLRGMQVYSQVLLEDFGKTMNPEARHCLRRISENANRLDKMVTDVLLFSRISRAEIKMERVNLDKLARDIVQIYPSLQKPAANVEIAPLHDVIGHEPSLTQILSNLLANAAKFVAPGVAPEIRVWTEKDGDFVKLWVKDNGIGIEPDWHDRLFRMFERVHPHLPYEGTGVGLAVVRKAANRMGGEVGVVSKGNGGAAFWVRLRAAV